MQKVQCAATDNRGVVESECFGLDHHTMPQTTPCHQQSSGAIVLHFLPRGLNLQLSEALLKQRQTQRISQFEAVKGKGAGLA